MKSPKINFGFVCENCRAVNPPAAKTCRNHCRECLFSLHLDEKNPGDRSSQCGGKMRPIAILTGHRKSDFIILHQCERCQKLQKNRSAEDDNIEKMCEIAKNKMFTKEGEK